MSDLNTCLHNARAAFDGDALTVSTGVVERRWRWTGHGFATVSLRHLPTGREWVTAAREAASWTLPGVLPPDAEAKLVGVTARPSTDEGFTSEHLEVVAEVEYAAAGLAVQFVVWAYPDAPGLRTQLRVKARPHYAGGDLSGPACVDRIPISFERLTRRAVGYYNATQNRNKPETPLLEEQVVAESLAEPERYDWASLLGLEADAGGLWLVKESHKCVNQQGLETGAFHCDETGVWSSGWGLTPAEIVADRFRPCWASWCVLWAGAADDRDLALKQFDRLRYPLDPSRDMFIMSNTWGSTDGGRDAQARANEENVLVEIDSAADLGIDVHQIDDGWEGDDRKQWRRPVPERFPHGWRRVREAAAEKGVRLGLWAAGMPVPLEDLKCNYDEGGFTHYKLDFMHFCTYDQLEAVVDKVRAFILYTDHRVRVNWDVTENPARVGYFWAREFGNIYLANRKPAKPEGVVYIPHLVLRDAWHLAHYTNLNKFQITVQNLDRVNPDLSDAHLHNHPYCVALTLMGAPIFFQETQYYTDDAREQIRPLLALYKQHREALFRGYVFPVGDTPNNASWTGFQCHDPETDSGYLMVYRELHNQQPEASLSLHFVTGKQLRLTDLRSGGESTVAVGRDGAVAFALADAPAFGFYRYEA